MSKNLNLKISYHAKQAEILFGSKARFKVIRKGRRFGLTTAFAYYVIERMLDNTTPILWVDTVNSNIDRYMERYFIPVLRQLPSYCWQWRQQKKELSIGNSVCDFRSADIPENIEGFGYKLIILNEAGIILKDSYLYHNCILPMILDYNAEMLIGGTPKGRGLFYELSQREHTSKDWKTFHYTSYDNPFIDRSEIDELARSMPEIVRRQEIYAEFLESQSLVFRGVEKCIKGTLEKPVAGKLYYAGLDLAKWQDWTVLIIIDDTGHVVFFDRINQLDWSYQKRWIYEHVTRYNAKVTIDSTGVGDAIYDDLKRMGLQIVPYRITAESKKRLIENLMLAIEMEEVTFPDIPELVRELYNFEYTITASGVKYSAPAGQHDDCVIALALALHTGVRSVGMPHVITRRRRESLDMLQGF